MEIIGLDNKWLRLDAFIEREVIPSYIQVKKIGMKDLKYIPFIHLDDIKSLNFSEVTTKHIFDYLAQKEIVITKKGSRLSNLEFDIDKNYQILRDQFYEYYKKRSSSLRESLIMQNARLATYWAYSYAKKFHCDVRELESYAFEGLIKSIDFFKPSVKNRLWTYMKKYIESYMNFGLAHIYGVKDEDTFKLLEKAGRSLGENGNTIYDITNLLVEQGQINSKKAKDLREMVLINNPSSLNTEVKENDLVDEYSLYYKIALEMAKEELKESFHSNLNYHQQQIFAERFHNGDNACTSSTKIAKKNNISSTRVMKIIAECLRKMGHAKNSKNLLSSYEDLCEFNIPLKSSNKGTKCKK